MKMSTPYDVFDYLGYWEDRTFEDSCERIAVGKLLNQIGKRDSLVDIGGGFGRLIPLYAPLFRKCLVVDPSEKLLEIGREKAKENKNVFFRKGALPDLPLKDNSFDVALMVRVSHHLSDPLPSLTKISRLLKKNGFLVLEIANKIHFLARVRALLTVDFSFVHDFSSVERRSPVNIRQKTIAFSNHHPQKIINDLNRLGFSITFVLSVSNFRQPWLKKIFPASLLLRLEDFLQQPLARFFFGPSIFILAQKES